ncbi:unnamed protein product [Trichobilharzia regenti]|nr:unnamed protein product [Trichobilharzia regenti]
MTLCQLILPVEEGDRWLALSTDFPSNKSDITTMVVYIPYIYMGCIHVIQSPSPYLIGMNSRFFDFFRLPPNGGIAYLDLDTNNFKPPTSFGQVTLDSKVLPKVSKQSTAHLIFYVCMLFSLLLVFFSLLFSSTMAIFYFEGSAKKIHCTNQGTLFKLTLSCKGLWGIVI